MNSFSQEYINESITILKEIDVFKLEKLAQELSDLRARNGRLFFLGVGGSAANASHAVNDFRKICGIETYTPTDNASELTARTNDEGWASVFTEWLKVSRFNKSDAIFILSVGGGDKERNVSPNLVAAIDLAKNIGSKVFGIVGRNNGHTAIHADVSIIVPIHNPVHTTPHAEAFQGVFLHLLVSHPLLKVVPTKWETLVK